MTEPTLKVGDIIEKIRVVSHPGQSNILRGEIINIEEGYAFGRKVVHYLIKWHDYETVNEKKIKDFRYVGKAEV